MYINIEIQNCSLRRNRYPNFRPITTSSTGKALKTRF